MSAHAEHLPQGHDSHEHHGPPTPHYSSRVPPAVLGMFLFIGTEIMLFGSFFTAYFFVRVVNPDASAIWHCPVTSRGSFRMSALIAEPDPRRSPETV